MNTQANESYLNELETILAEEANNFGEQSTEEEEQETEKKVTKKKPEKSKPEKLKPKPSVEVKDKSSDLTKLTPLESRLKEEIETGGFNILTLREYINYSINKFLSEMGLNSKPTSSGDVTDNDGIKTLHEKLINPESISKYAGSNYTFTGKKFDEINNISIIFLAYGKKGKELEIVITNKLLNCEFQVRRKGGEEFLDIDLGSKGDAKVKIYNPGNAITETTKRVSGTRGAITRMVKILNELTIRLSAV